MLVHLRRHFKRLVQLPGQHNLAIGEAFINLIDEAFKNYRVLQDTGSHVIKDLCSPRSLFGFDLLMIALNQCCFLRL